LKNYVEQFNRTNNDYYIHIIDYSDFNTEDDWTIGITKLSTDIVSGRTPDILDVSNLPFSRYVDRGLLVDLYTLLDADPKFRRSDFFESVLRASELDGGLYRIFPYFYVTTVLGHPSVLGSDMGWTIDEFETVLDANSQADFPMGQYMNNEQFLFSAIWVTIDEFVDWEAGEVHFDTGAFAKLLELAGRFPKDFIYSEADENALIATGRQIMMPTSIWDFQGFQRYLSMFGGEIVFKGFPTESANGNSLFIGSSLAITTSSADIDGAWEFLSGFLASDWQREHVMHVGFPTNISAFNYLIDDAGREMEEHEDDFVNPLTQEDIDSFIALIESVHSIASHDDALMNIIRDGASDFFNGNASAQDVARIIQGRASIFMAEQQR